MWAAILAGVSAIISLAMQSAQNKDLAEYQADRNEAYLKEQQDFNLPINQMQRFKDAGLNPALIYGQGNAGNQSVPLSFPNIQPTDYIRGVQGVAEAGMQALQARLMNAQVAAVEAKTIESQARSGLLDIQKQIAEANPYLNKAAAAAMSEQWISAARIKANEASMVMQKQNWRTRIEDGEMSSNGFRIMDAELNNLEQRFKLYQSDLKIKAAILESKEFQNAVLEVQKKFMTEGDLTPQHFISFIQLLLMKFSMR